jgi:adenylate cyclase
VLYNAACVYSLLGNIDIGIDYLDRAVTSGFAFREWIENDSDLDNIRDDPRFQEIVDRIK